MADVQESPHSVEKDAYGGWTGCVHCGQTLPHEGTGWRESSRCRLLQRIAEQAWRQGAITALDFATRNEDGITLSLDLGAHPNPYATSVTPLGNGETS